MFRLNGPGEFNIVPYSNIYARVRFGNALDLKERALKNTTTTFSTEGISSIYDLETYVYSADRISSIGDLSDFNIGLCNFASASKLKEIILGSEREGYQNEHLKNFRAGASTVLQEVNLSNCINLAMGINLEQCPNLQIFKAAGSAITGVTFARGARLSTCKLPKSMTYLSLLDLKYLNEEGLYIETKENGKYAFTGIRIENCPNLPFYDLIMNSDNLNYLTLKGLNWETTLSEFTTFFNKVKTLKGLDENGAEMPNINAQISGKVYLTESITDELLEEINALFPELVIVVNGAPQYFLTFKDYKNETICRYIAGENSIPLDPTKVEIPGLDKTPAQILALLNSRPGEDRVDPTGEIDTRYIFNNWANLPERVVSSLVITPEYKEEYRIKFLQENGEDKIIPDIWVVKGENAPDPREQDPPVFATKEPDAEFSYIHSGWSGSLLNIQRPQSFTAVFSKEINKYTVHFYAGEKLLNGPEENGIMIVEYGQAIIPPDTYKVFNYYYNEETNMYEYKPYYEHIGWDVSGESYSPSGMIIIAPPSYTTSPVNIYAKFSSFEYITDSWETIYNNCYNANETYKNKYPIGCEKQINFKFNGKNYIGYAEIVDQDYDILVDPIMVNGKTKTKASLTFIVKNIYFDDSNLTTGSHTWPPNAAPEDVITSGYAAGGWTNLKLYEPLHTIEFNDELKDYVHQVYKKTDFGPSADLITEYLGFEKIAEKTWTPSASEVNLNAVDIGTKIAGIQYGDGENSPERPYSIFNNNESRKKFFDKNGNDMMDAEENNFIYFLRTYVPTTGFRFYAVNVDGGTYIGSNSAGALAYPGNADGPVGLIFGFCI